METVEAIKYIVLGVLNVGIGGAAIKALYNWYHRSVERLETEVDDLKRKLADSERRVTELGEEARNAKDDRENSVKELSVLQGQHGSLEKQAEETTRLKEQAEKRLEEFKQHADRKYAEQREKYKREYGGRITTLEAQLAERQQEVDRLHLEAAEVVAEKESLTVKLEEARAKLATERRTIRETLRHQGRIWTTKVPRDAPRFRPLKDRRTVIIAVLNLKGGVGKTTITANLAGLLGSQGKKVLMIDLDHQRSLSRMLLAGTFLSNLVVQKRSIQTFFTGAAMGGPQLLANSVSVDGMPNCELIVNHDPLESESTDGEYGLEELEMQMQLSWLLDTENTGDIRFYLREGLHSESVDSSFDYVLLDCPPRMSTACVNALAAADFVLIPVQGEAVAARSVEHIVYRLRELREGGPCTSLRTLGILGNLVHPVSDMESAPEVARLREMAANLSLHGTWPESIETFTTVLPRMRQYLDASNELGQGSKLRLAISFPSVRTQFEQLVKEIEDRIHDHRNAE